MPLLLMHLLDDLVPPVAHVSRSHYVLEDYLVASHIALLLQAFQVQVCLLIRLQQSRQIASSHSLLILIEACPDHSGK